MEMPTTRTGSARPSLSLFDLVAASSVAENALQHHHEQADAVVTDVDVDSSFSALLTAISTATPLPTSPPTTAGSDASTKEDKQTQRRERNRLSCRKARLKRKLERLGQSLLVQRREERQAELLDLRDELTAASTKAAAPTNPLRGFVTKSLHYALLDDDYMAAKQRASATERVSLGWPTRALTGSMMKQWQRITSDVMNAQLTINELIEETNKDTKTAVVQCKWTLRGVSESGVETRCREEPLQYDGKTVLRFVGRAITSIQLSATPVEIKTQRGEEGEDEDTESEPEGEDAAYAITV